MNERYPSSDIELPPRGRRFMQIGWLTLIVLSMSAANNSHSGDMLVTNLTLGAFALVAIAMWKGKEISLDGAIIMVVLTLASLVAASMWLTNGLHDVAALALPAILFISVLLLEGRFVWLLLGSIIVFSGGLFATELAGWSAVRETGPASVRTLIDFSMILAATAYCAWLLTGDLRQAVSAARNQTQRAMQATGRIQEAEQSAQLAQLIFEKAGEAIFVSDLDGRLLGANPAACRLAKYSRTEMLKLHIADILTGFDKSRIAVDLALCDAGQAIESQLSLQCADGSTVPLDLMIQRLPDDRYLLIGRDLSEKERVDQQLVLARVAVEDAEHIKFQLLTQASQGLWAPADAIHRQIAALSHTALSPEQRNHLEQIEQSVKSLEQSISSLFDEAQKKTLSPDFRQPAGRA